MASPDLLEKPGFLKKLLPFESRYADVSGHKLHYIDEGSGPVVLLLHGNPTWCFYYRDLIARLRTKFRVIAPDHLGCGLSEHPDKRFRARDRMAHLEEFLSALGIEKFSLVVHDWGGPIGTGVAVRNVDKIEKVVYLNTTITETESLPLIIKTAAKPFPGKFLTKYSTRFLKLTVEVGAAKKLSKEVIDGYLYPYRTSKDRTAIWNFVDDIPFSSAHPTYQEMVWIAKGLPELAKKPVQVIWGLKDPCFHKEMLNKLLKHFPNASVLEIPEASHLVLEDAKDLAFDAIEKFLIHGEASNAKAKDESTIVPSKVPVLYEKLSQHVSTFPNEAAAIIPSFLGQRVSYQQLKFSEVFALINQYRRGLLALGLKPGYRVLMLVPPGVDFLALTYALMAEGAIPVFIDPGIRRDHLLQCLSDLRPDVFIGSPKAHLLKMLKSQAFATVKFQIVASDFSIGRSPNLSFLKRFAATPAPPSVWNDTAFVAFTSGATGRPKGVVFTQRMLAAQLEILSKQFKMERGGKDLPLLPIFALFNLGLGVGSVFAPLDSSKPLALDPSKIIKIITDLSVSSSFGSPTLWRKIAEYALRTNTKLPSIKRIHMAGAPVPEATLSLVQELLPHGAAFTPYGATEALPVSLIDASEILKLEKKQAKSGEFGILVGAAVKGIEIRVIEQVDGPIFNLSQAKSAAPYEIGEIIVSGENVSERYLDNDIATQSGKIKDGSRTWHRMGDVGYLDEAGNLYFCGRKMHAVRTKERTLYSIPVERLFNAHPKVSRSALIDLGSGNPGIVIEPHATYWPETHEAELNFCSEIKEIAKKNELTNSIDRVFFHRSFPVDNRHNAKIYRDQLAEWAKQQVA